MVILMSIKFILLANEGTYDSSVLDYQTVLYKDWYNLTLVQRNPYKELLKRWWLIILKYIEDYNESTKNSTLLGMRIDIFDRFTDEHQWLYKSIAIMGLSMVFRVEWTKLVVG